MTEPISRRTAIAGVTAACTAAVLPAMAEDRQTLDLAQYRNKVVYLDFWASWCAPCLQSFPWMTEIQRIYGSRGLVVVAVNVDRDNQLAHRFLQDKLVNFRIVYDPEGAIAKQYAIRDMPTSMLIGPDGR